MKRIIALLLTLALTLSFGIGAISAANEKVFAKAVLDEEAQLALEKAALEFANGNDTEGFAAEEDATNNFGKTQLGFNIMGGVVASAGWCPGIPIRIHKPMCHSCAFVVIVGVV